MCAVVVSSVFVRLATVSLIAKKRFYSLLHFISEVVPSYFSKAVKLVLLHWPHNLNSLYIFTSVHDVKTFTCNANVVPCPWLEGVKCLCLASHVLCLRLNAASSQSTWCSILTSAASPGFSDSWTLAVSWTVNGVWGGGFSLFFFFCRSVA